MAIDFSIIRILNKVREHLPYRINILQDGNIGRSYGGNSNVAANIGQCVTSFNNNPPEQAPPV
jgi:hypothetical protein